METKKNQKTGNKKPRVLLVMPAGKRPVFFAKNWKLMPRDFGEFPPLGLLYLASSLREKAGADVRVIDAAATGMTTGEIAKEAETFRPHVTGVTSFTVTFGETLEIARKVKSSHKDTHVCVGGPHVKTFPDLTINHEPIDSIIIGEGEEVFPSLVSFLSGNGTGNMPGGLITKDNLSSIAKPPPVNRITNLDDLPFPARDLVSNTRYYSVVGIRPKCITVITSRGCPYHCTFCDVPFDTTLTRSVDNVIEEIKQCSPGRHEEIFFFDDTFNLSKKRLSSFSEKMGHTFNLPWSFRGRVTAMNEELLRDAAKSGCFQIHLGIETCRDENLDYLKKDITYEQVRDALDAAHKAGIRVIANMMIALPFEKSEEDIYNNIREVMRLNPYMIQTSIFELIPGTEIFEQGVEKGLVTWDEWNEYVGNPTPDFVPKSWDEYIDQDQLGRIWQNCYKMVYFRPAKIFEFLLKTRSFWEFKQKFISALKLLFNK